MLYHGCRNTIKQRQLRKEAGERGHEIKALAQNEDCGREKKRKKASLAWLLLNGTKASKLTSSNAHCSTNSGEENDVTPIHVLGASGNTSFWPSFKVMTSLTKFAQAVGSAKKNPLILAVRALVLERHCATPEWFS